MSGLDIVEVSVLKCDSINIKKPLEYPNDNTYIFDLYYNNKVLLVPLRNLQICNKGKIIKFIDTSVCLNDLKKIVDKITSRVKKNTKYEGLFKNKEMYNMISNETAVINFKNVCEYDTSVFDIDGNEIEMSRLKKSDNVVIVVYVKSLWINDKFYGINLKLSQIHRMEPLGLKKSLLVQKVVSTPKLPPPPPPPPQQNVQKREINKVVRPSLNDILKSREKLRKTNLLS